MENSGNPDFTASFYCVETPLQLINAMEAKNHFGGDGKNILLVLFDGYPVNKQQIQNLLGQKFTSFDKIFFIRRTTNGGMIAKMIIKAFYIIRLYLLVKTLKNKFSGFKNMFFGILPADYTQILSSEIAHGHFFLLDDGNVTLEIQDTLLNPNSPYYIEKNSSLQNRKILLALFPGLKSNKKTVHLFTCFDLIPHLNQRIIKNQFNLIKSHTLINSFRVEANVFFFGCFPSGMNIFSEEVYLTLLNRVSAYFKKKGKKIYYIPHRRELPEVVQKIEKIENFEIEFFNSPSEVEFMIRKTAPGMIASLYSTALFSVSRIFHETEVFSFYLEPKFIQPSHQHEVEEVYKHYGKLFKIIQPEELNIA